MVFAEGERADSGRLTRRSEHLIRSGVAIVLNCGSYILIITLTHVLIGSRRISIELWDKYSMFLRLLIVSADAFAVLPAILGFKTQGSRTWILRITAPIISVVSIFATFVFPTGD